MKNAALEALSRSGPGPGPASHGHRITKGGGSPPNFAVTATDGSLHTHDCSDSGIPGHTVTTRAPPEPADASGGKVGFEVATDGIQDVFSDLPTRPAAPNFKLNSDRDYRTTQSACGQ